MRSILLTQGKTALLDDEDYPRVINFSQNWHAVLSKNGQVWYARTDWMRPEGRTLLYMHKLVLRVPPKFLDVDHINHDGLDNQKKNLRLVPRWANGLNEKEIRASNSSGFRGVSWHKGKQKWTAYIGGRGSPQIQLGAFSSLEAAIEARQIAERKAWEEFNSLPPPTYEPYEYISLKRNYSTSATMPREDPPTLTLDDLGEDGNLKPELSFEDLGDFT